MICPICEQDCGGICEENDADKLSERQMLDREYQQSLRQETDPRDWDDNDGFDGMTEYDPDGPDEDEAFAAAEDDEVYSSAGEDSDVAQGRFDDGE